MFIKKDNKYFCWGLTIFLVVAASIGVYYCLFHISSLISLWKQFIDILQPIIIGIAMAYLFCPLLNYFEERIFSSPIFKKREKTKLNRRVVRIISIVLTMIVVIILIYSFIGLIAPQLYYSIKNILVQSNTYISNLENWIKDVFSENPLISKYLEDFTRDYSKIIKDIVDTKILPELETIVLSVSSGAIEVIAILFDVIVGFIISIYLLYGKDRFIAQGKKIIYAYSDIKKANTFIRDVRYAHRTFSGFLNGKIIDSIIIGILCFIGSVIFKFPFPFLISVIIGVTNIIPYFGPFIGAIPCALLVLLIEPNMTIIFVIFILVLQQIDGNIIGPSILGEYTGLTSFWVIFSITIFGGLFGVFGMVIGVPCFAVIYTLIKRNLKYNLNRKGLSENTEKYINLNEIDVEEKYIYNAEKTKKTRIKKKADK